ncbi:hypothetical protein IE53DRAFT_334217 [Violaceomyces palustris]|uniref:Uncharacterized protein n=1 Tax=Violaceomyces palustris TaxID=1673888 RepID=A0ACD0NQS7_9BASI|nr:hypothetical protein IE53DRAFT_334217 [Violaceomyces palustris]
MLGRPGCGCHDRSGSNPTRNFHLRLSDQNSSKLTSVTPVQKRFRSGRRIRWSASKPAPSGLLLLLLITILCLLSFSVVRAQDTAQEEVVDALSSATESTSSGSIVPTTTSTSEVADATSTTAVLQDSVVTRVNLDATSNVGAFFRMEANTSDPIYVSMSICTGPEIPAYNSSNATLVKQLGLSATQVRRSTLLGLYVSDQPEVPEPGADSGLKSNRFSFAQGGWASVELEKGSDQGIWIGVWPPVDTRNVTGTFELRIVASTKARMESVDSTIFPTLDDTDSTRALVTLYNHTAPSAQNLTLIVLPTFGEFSLPSAAYFNSSFCAILDAWEGLRGGSNSIKVNSTVSNTTSETIQSAGGGTNLTELDPLLNRVRFEIGNLQRGTNYTAWMVLGTNVSDTITSVLFPAIKFKTKSSENCRLVHDIDFCPQVAYSIPVNPSISTERALSVIQETINPSFSNFSEMIDTFPCGDAYFGMYSYVQTCQACKESYRNWLCAVTMPRCTDPVESDDQSRASQNGSELTGAPSGPNTKLLPYIVNRSNNTSRQPYIDQDLQAGTYGELLPCIYNCYFVSRTCPPTIQWACPEWDVTAQRDYGTFADSGNHGLGAGENGGPGYDLQRWGGPTRYIATDNFGNTYCNALGVDQLVRQLNSSPPLPIRTPPLHLLLTLITVTCLLL